MVGGALLLIGVAQSYYMLLFAFLCLGFGPSMFHPPAVGALSRRFADRRAFAISLHGTGGSIGEALGPLTAAGLLGLLFWPLFFTNVGPKMTAALWLDSGYEFYRLHGDRPTAIDAQLSTMTFGFALGSDF